MQNQFFLIPFKSCKSEISEHCAEKYTIEAFENEVNADRRWTMRRLETRSLLRFIDTIVASVKRCKNVKSSCCQSLL